MTTIRLPYIPEVSGKTVKEDQELRELLIAIKQTLEKITSSTQAEFHALLDLNN